MIRTLLTAVLCAAASLAAAQTDVTAYFLKNAGFDTAFDYTADQTTAVKQEILPVAGWTSVTPADYTIVGTYEFGFQGTFNTATVPSAGYDGAAGGGLAISTGWEVTFQFYQDVTLPAGTYTLRVPTWNGSDVTAATSQVAWVPATGTAVKSSVTSYTARDWTVDEVKFTLDKATAGRVQFGMKAPAGGSSKSAKLVVDCVQLLGEDIDAAPALSDLITSATTLLADGTGHGADALGQAIDAARTTLQDAQSGVTDLLSAQQSLTAAVAAYRLQNASEDNPIDCTQLLSEPSFEGGLNGWTAVGMKRQSNTAFAKKSGTYYVEKWVNRGTQLGDASLSQTVAALPLGKYRVAASAHIQDQLNVAAECSGVALFADQMETPVTATADYTVTFTNVVGDITLGLRAVSATGNWLAVDNFRLELVGEVSPSDIVAEVTRRAAVAQTLLQQQMSDAVRTTLETAIADLATLTLESSTDAVAEKVRTLDAAVADARTSAGLYAALAQAVATAETVQQENAAAMQSAAVRDALASALAQAKEISGASTASQVTAKTTLVTQATEAVRSSVAAYAALSSKADEAASLIDKSLADADVLEQAVAHAREAAKDESLTAAALAAESDDLDRAVLAFRLANATAGTGKAPAVTQTVQHFAAGSTQALIRAAMTGANILEKGVCWSTHHEPTVLDERTTKSFSLNGFIFHIKGLKPATVYYVRPYVMNQTYTVAYGDEIKVVTHPQGNCSWSWNEGAPDADANTRCRNAIRETIEYFNEWTGIMGFKLSGRYGSGTPTADCGYGGSMRIGPSAAYQAIGTVLHETGHGVGVGTHSRWYSCADTRANTTGGAWLGRAATEAYQFLENKYTDDYIFGGDRTHGWGHSATYDWFVNGADKDKHLELQYIGGMTIYYGLFLDGLCPPGYSNGVAGYTCQFDDSTRYYLMSKSADRGLGTALLYQRTGTTPSWRPMLTDEGEVGDEAAWYVSFDPQTGLYSFRNASSGRYLSRNSTYVSVRALDKPGTTEQFQLMPDRTDVTLGSGADALTTHGYWLTWNSGSNQALSASAIQSVGYGSVAQAAFDYSDRATAQQWILIPETDLAAVRRAALATAVERIEVGAADATGQRTVQSVHTAAGIRVPAPVRGVNIIRYSDGTVRRVLVP